MNSFNLCTHNSFAESFVESGENQRDSFMIIAGRANRAAVKIAQRTLNRNTRENRPQSAANEVHTADYAVPFPRHVLPEQARQIDDRFVRFRAIGRSDAPTVLVLGGISAGRMIGEPDATAWWPEIIGVGKAIDTTKYRVIGVDYFPLAPKNAIDLSPNDFARVYLAALEKLGVLRLHGIIGASFGGMIAQEMAVIAPEKIERLCVLCAADKPSAMGRAWRRVQQRIIDLGQRLGAADEGAAIARELAVTTYRTSAEFNDRFRDDQSVEDYLGYQGEKFLQNMSPVRYRTLSAAIDRHAIDPCKITLPVTVIAFEEDQLVPVEDARRLAQGVTGRSRFRLFSSPYGHDAFLKESALIGPVIKSCLEECN